MKDLKYKKDTLVPQSAHMSNLKVGMPLLVAHYLTPLQICTLKLTSINSQGPPRRVRYIMELQDYEY